MWLPGPHIFQAGWAFEDPGHTAGYHKKLSESLIGIACTLLREDNDPLFFVGPPFINN